MQSSTVAIILIQTMNSEEAKCTFPTHIHKKKKKKKKKVSLD